VEGPQQLSDVLASLLRALVTARGAMDNASADLAKIYWADPVLRSMPLPAFSMPEVKVHLKFAVSGLTSSGGRLGTAASDMRVVVDLPSLENLPAHLISELELRLTPQMLRAFEAETDDAMAARA
jgi:hypothetical protein